MFWRFTSHVLDKDESTPPVSPAFNAASGKQHFRDVYSSQPHVIAHPDWLRQAASPHTPLDFYVIRPKKVAIVQSNILTAPLLLVPSITFHTGSSNSVSLSFLLLSILLYNICWQTTVVPRAWMTVVITLIPKSSAADDLTRPGNAHPISLTSLCWQDF